VWGQGDGAVRALSGLISVGTLPLFWFAGRRLGGRTVAWVTFLLGVTSPFAIYYATTARMYSLMVLWGLLGFLALVRALEAPTPVRLVPLAVAVAGMLYTHYWALYLVAITAAWLVYQIWRHRRGLPIRTTPVALRRALAAVVAGSLLFAPWVPIFVFQTMHTGTPWASAAGPADLLGVFGDYAGTGPWAALLAFLYFGLIVLGVFGRRADVDLPGAPGVSAKDDAALIASGLELAPRRLKARVVAGIDRAVGFVGFGPGGAGASARRRQPGRGVTLVLQPNARALPVAGVLIGTLLLAVVAGAVAQAAFVARYTAVVLPLFLLLTALGVGVLGRRRLVGGVLAVLCVAGLLTGLGNNGQARTQAGVVAAVLNVDARPDDMVVYCPDQLGPAVDRLLVVPAVTELTFPRAIGAQRVDWVNYRATIDRTDVETFAQEMIARLAPGHTMFLVWSDGYPGLGSSCGNLQSWLALLLGQGAVLVHQKRSFYENENLTRYPS
jgi:mannosyltransferase